LWQNSDSNGSYSLKVSLPCCGRSNGSYSFSLINRAFHLLLSSMTILSFFLSFALYVTLNFNHLVPQDVVNDRIKHCMKHVAGDADECSVCAGTGKCRLY